MSHFTGPYKNIKILLVLIKPNCRDRATSLSQRGFQSSIRWRIQWICFWSL